MRSMSWVIVDFVEWSMMARWRLGPVWFKIPIHFVERINIFQAKCLILPYDSALHIHILFVIKLVLLIQFLQMKKNRFIFDNCKILSAFFGQKNWIVENWNGKLDFEISTFRAPRRGARGWPRSRARGKADYCCYFFHLSCRNFKGRSPREINNTWWLFLYFKNT